jgi:hypothetical protein
MIMLSSRTRLVEAISKAIAAVNKKFTITSHTELWQKLKAKDATKALGVAVGKQWCWYETWLNRVREECQKEPARYGLAPSGPPLPLPSTALTSTSEISSTVGSIGEGSKTCAR